MGGGPAGARKGVTCWGGPCIGKDSESAMGLTSVRFRWRASDHHLILNLPAQFAELPN
jgi:hypothetical protein